MLLGLGTYLLIIQQPIGECMIKIGGFTDLDVKCFININQKSMENNSLRFLSYQ